LLWAGASPVLAYNLVLIAGFALNGWVMALVIRAWTGDTAAGVLSGILFAFNAHIFTRLPHMQAQHVEFLPLALLALDRVVSAPRVRDAAAFGAMVALQALTSVYLAMFTVCAMTAAFVVRPGDWMATTWRRVWSHLVLAGGVAAAIATPFMLPYLFVHNVQGFERSLDEVATMSATLTSYLSTPGRLHYALWSHRWFGGPAVLFPGVTATLLGALAVVTGTAWRDRRARMCLAVGVCGVLLSFGPKLPGYSVLFAVVPLFRVVRVVASIGYLGLVGLAMVAGFGMVDLRRRVTPAVWPLIASVVFVCATIEPMAAPLELIRAVPPAGIYDLLRDEKDAVVVELPFHTEAAGFAQVAYMMNSTRHWRPMLNGYSGYRPDSYYRSAEMLEGFPSARSMAWLREQGVTHVFAHLHELDADARERLDATAGLRRVAISRGIALLRLDPLR
jgi:hypothetical protein